MVLWGRSQLWKKNSYKYSTEPLCAKVFHCSFTSFPPPLTPRPRVIFFTPTCTFVNAHLNCRPFSHVGICFLCPSVFHTNITAIPRNTTEVHGNTQLTFSPTVFLCSSFTVEAGVTWCLFRVVNTWDWIGATQAEINLFVDNICLHYKVKVSYLTLVAKQAKTAFIHGPTVWKSPIVGIEPTTFRSEKRCTNHLHHICTTVHWWAPIGQNSQTLYRFTFWILCLRLTIRQENQNNENTLVTMNKSESRLQCKENQNIWRRTKNPPRFSTITLHTESSSFWRTYWKTSSLNSLRTCHPLRTLIFLRKTFWKYVKARFDKNVAWCYEKPCLAPKFCVLRNASWQYTPNLCTPSVALHLCTPSVALHLCTSTLPQIFKH